MTRPSDLLNGQQPQFEIDSPEQRYDRGMKAVQGIVREQGQVMSAALDNNWSLYHTNKRLRSELAAVKGEVTALTFQLQGARRELERLGTVDLTAAAALQDEVIGLRAANAQLKRELIASMYPEITAGQRKESLLSLQEQAREIAAMRRDGLVPTEDEINEEPEGTAAASREAVRLAVLSAAELQP